VTLTSFGGTAAFRYLGPFSIMAVKGSDVKRKSPIVAGGGQVSFFNSSHSVDHFK
jgi:hypothetical protein